MTALFLTSDAAWGLEVAGSLSGDQRWFKSDSPVRVMNVVTVADKATLTIGPGVEVLFAPGSGIIVQGRLEVVGEAGDSVYFTPERPGESWAGILVLGGSTGSNSSSYQDTSSYQCRIRYAVFEGARPNHPQIDAPLSLQATKAFITHTSFRHLQGTNGSVKASLTSQVQFEDCIWEGNSAQHGGAVVVTTGADAQFNRCRFVKNSAQTQGGALYATLADITIRNSLFIENRSQIFGGAISGVRMGTLILEQNFWYGNKSLERGNNIILQEQVSATITRNHFQNLEDVIYLWKAKGEVTARENWWGQPPSQVRFTDLVRDRQVDPQEPKIDLSSPLWAPPPGSPWLPTTIMSIMACRDASFSTPLPLGTAIGAKLRIRVEAVESIPSLPEVITGKAISLTDPQGILFPLYEDPVNPGVFRGEILIATQTDQPSYSLKSRVGEEITVSIPQLEHLAVARIPVIPPNPIILSMDFYPSQDLFHITTPHPTLAWEYYDVLEFPQKAVRCKVWREDNLSEPVWDSGPIASSQNSLTYGGTRLQEGESYKWQIEVSNGRLWSEPKTLSFRMNSKPLPPPIISPSHREIIASPLIVLTLAQGQDREGDTLWYDVEIRETPQGEKVWNIDRYHSPSPSFTLTPPPLKENAIYHLRARSYDGFEEGGWSSPLEFAINAVPEPPDPVIVIWPNHNDTIYQLQPVFRWQKAVDPDPYDQVQYTLLLSSDPEGKFPVHQVEGINTTTYQLPFALNNRTWYYLRLWAIDLSGLKSSPEGYTQFFTETTPSVPQLLLPSSESELTPQGKFTWLPSRDPDPNDKLVYELEISSDPSFSQTIVRSHPVSATELGIQGLPGASDLTDNTIYYWRVRAIDPHGVSSEPAPAQAFFYNSINDPPLVSALKALPDTVRGTTNVTFQWEAATDPDRSDPPSTLVYELEIAPDSEFSSSGVQRISSMPGALELAHQLGDNSTWYYRLRAKDDEGAVSAWTVPLRVVVDAFPEPPRPFSLKSPADGSEVATVDSILFTWEATTDPDPGDVLLYRWELTFPGGKVERLATREPQLLWQEPLPNEATFTWRVLAEDRTALSTQSRKAFTFRTNTTPSAPQPQSIALRTVGAESFLEWLPSKDPDPRDHLSYQVELASDSLFHRILSSINDLVEIKLPINRLPQYESLPENERVWWRVRAYDQRGVYSGWSKPAPITINLINDPPSTFNLLEPRDGDTLPIPKVVLKWSRSVDPDPDTKLTYRLLLSRDPQFQEVLLNIKNLTVENFSVPEGVLEPGGIYYWKVIADDGQGGTTVAPPGEESWHFIIKVP